MSERKSEEHLAVRIVTILAGTALAIVSMLLGSCVYVQYIPYYRQVYCIEHGYSYTWDQQSNMVTCKEK